MNGRSANRLIDANRNRASEGLRVLEDLARFLFDDPALARRAKNLRHQIRALPSDPGDRDTPGDQGTKIKAADEGNRGDLTGLIRANAARVQEALRCAEEASKLGADCGALTPGTDAPWAVLEAARYAAYTLESDLLARLPGWKLRSVKLYALIDPGLCADPLAVAVAVARGGAGAVQLRAKPLAVRAYRELAARIQDAVRGKGALFIVNDHVAIARAIGADGIHVGQDDLSVADARTVVGTGCAIGVSCHTPEQTADALRDGADYLGLGPIHGTTTKPHEPERGPGLLDAVAGIVDRPSYAIGGLDRDRVLALRGRFPHGIAVAGALCRAADPERAAAELLEALG